MSRIKDDDVQALRERADIVEVVSGYTNLKKSGGHTYKGLCPFHAEKTPSFSVDASKSMFFCFGCQEGGDIYHFVEKVESLAFTEAVEWLARKTGFHLHYEEMRPGERAAHGLKARLIAANEAAADHFHRQLMNAPEAAEARRYLGSRSFGREAAVRWKLGYAPGRDSLTKHLLSAGFSEEELVKADLTRRSERDGGLYDTFRQRIVFPTWNLQGDIVAFGGRRLASSDQGPKYLNTSETPVFSKSRVMYGLHRAKRAIARNNVAVVVEGYTDVIALQEAGVEEAVATNGVALGETHFEQLKKFAERVVLMLDADQAGKGATERSFEVYKRLGIEVLVGPLPAGRDPADVVLEGGADGIKKVIESARPLLDFKLEQVIAKHRLDTPEDRARAVREAALVLGWHPDPIARHQYATIAAERIGVDPEGIQRALDEELSEAAHRAREESVTRDRDRRLPGHVKVEREALQLLVAGSTDMAPWAADLDHSHFTAPARRELFQAAQRAPDPSSIAGDLSDEARSLFAELSFEAATMIRSPEHVREVFTRLKIFALERDIKTRRETLQEVNPLEDARRHDALFSELVKLEAERRDLLRTIQGAA